MQRNRIILEYRPIDPMRYITLEVDEALSHGRYQVRDWRLEGEDYKCHVTGSETNRRGYRRRPWANDYYHYLFEVINPKAPHPYKLSELPIGLLKIKGHAKHPIPNDRPPRPYTLADTIFFELEDGTLGFCQYQVF